jgi:hypothetical protein
VFRNPKTVRRPPRKKHRALLERRRRVNFRTGDRSGMHSAPVAPTEPFLDVSFSPSCIELVAANLPVRIYPTGESQGLWGDLSASPRLKSCAVCGGASTNRQIAGPAGYSAIARKVSRCRWDDNFVASPSPKEH